MSIKYKIALMTVIVALIPLVVLTVMMLFFYGRALMERADRQIGDNTRIMSDHISAVFSDGELCGNNLAIEFSNLYSNRNMRQVTRDSNILSLLSQTSLIYKGISSVVFVDNLGRFYSSDPSLISVKKDFEDSDYISTLSDTGTGTVLMDQEGNPFDREEAGVLTLGKRCYSIRTGTSLGYLFVNMSRDYLALSSQSEISFYFLFDDDGKLITTNDPQEPVCQDEEFAKGLLATDKSLIKHEGISYLIAKSKISGYGMEIVGVTDLNRFNVTGRDLFFMLAIAFGITAVLLAISVFFSANLVTRRLKLLHDGAQQIAEGDMSYRFRFPAKDEIGRLGRILNYMTQSNLELLQRVDEEAGKKREYELALIQEQVKPHFLYNTLDIIVMLIEMDRSREAARVTRKLANYYKNSLSGSEEVVTIERELQIVTDYLDLQTMRYGDKFSYDLDIDSMVSDSLVPKMTLQPLVENAIYHGLKNKADWGTITIVAEYSGDCVLLSVIDDGIGMSPEDVEKLNLILSDNGRDEKKKLQEEATITDHDSLGGGSHFGLYSVARRIKLYFGEEYGAVVTSNEGEGTVVTVRVPMKGSGDTDDQDNDR